MTSKKHCDFCNGYGYFAFMLDVMHSICPTCKGKNVTRNNLPPEGFSLSQQHVDGKLIMTVERVEGQ